MAHGIEVNEEGFAPMAFVGETPWHGLGQELTEKSNLEEWKEQAGFQWNIEEVPMGFKHHETDTFIQSALPKKILYRSDTLKELSIVGENYKVVQPDEILEFFRDLVGVAGMKLNTAGVLFGGKKFWALADTGNFGSLNGNDKIKGNLLLTSSCDGFSATTVSLVSTRVVCNNTLTVALSENRHGALKIAHNTEFDASIVKEKMGLIDNQWNGFMESITKLSETGISQAKAKSFVETFLEIDPENPSKQRADTMSNILNRFNNGMGNNGKTAWDLLNGVTEYYEHHKGKNKSMDSKVWGNFKGGEDDQKTKAYKMAMDLVVA